MYSRLQVVNAMIVSTGMRPFAEQNPNHPLYFKADTLRSSIQAQVCGIGLYFNTETRDFDADPITGEIILPTECVKADPVDGNINLTLRNGKMWDLDNATYEIGKTVRMRTIWDLPFEEIPLYGQEYIRARCVYQFYLDEDGVEPKLSNYRAERDMWWQMLYREHLNNVQANIYGNPRNAINQMRKGVGYGRWKPMVR